jgi:hypothetical protein
VNFEFPWTEELLQPPFSMWILVKTPSTLSSTWLARESSGPPSERLGFSSQHPQGGWTAGGRYNYCKTKCMLLIVNSHTECAFDPFPKQVTNPSKHCTRAKGHKENLSKSTLVSLVKRQYLSEEGFDLAKF